MVVKNLNLCAIFTIDLLEVFNSKGELNMKEKENIENSIANCSFVLTDENKTTVAIQDNQDGGFILLAKGQGEEAARIVKEAEKQMKLVVETEDVVPIYNNVEPGENFTQYDPFLIDIMEEFRLIKTGSKKPGGKS